MTSKTHAWVVAYIDSGYLDSLYSDLKRIPEFKEIEVYIPTVKILKKTFKGENHFENVPLLFNYGFFKIPRKYAIYQSYLENMKRNIRCIFQWVRDPVKVISTKPRLRRDHQSIYDKDTDIPVATATSQEIAELVQSAFYATLHDEDQVGSLKPGQQIQLQGYPFQDMWAEVIEILPKKRQIKVNIHLIDAIRPATIAFDNVFYTVYQNKGYDDSISLQNSLDAMMDQKTADKAFFNNRDKSQD